MGPLGLDPRGHPRTGPWDETGQDPGDPSMGHPRQDCKKIQETLDENPGTGSLEWGRTGTKDLQGGTSEQDPLYGTGPLGLDGTLGNTQTEPPYGTLGQEPGMGWDRTLGWDPQDGTLGWDKTPGKGCDWQVEMGPGMGHVQIP